MHLDLAASLRCPRPHEASGLVLAADLVHGRRVITGVLGCPACDAEFPVRDGVVYFAPTCDTAASDSPVPESLIDAAAMLGLEVAGGIVLLGGSWAAHAAGIAQFGEALVVVVNPVGPVADVEAVSVICAADVLPLGARTLRAAAVDPSIAAFGGLVPALAQRARYVAPVAAPLPDGLRELARDAQFFVGEVAAPLLTLKRR